MDCGTWWFDHVGETYFYAIGTRLDDPLKQVDSLNKLVAMAQEWGPMVGIPAASDLMMKHVADVKVVIDGAFSADKASVDAAVERLLKNVEDQTDLYRKIPGFPVEEWHRLFLSHVTTTGGYVLALASGDAIDFRRNVDLTLNGMRGLAHLWTIVCSRR